MDTSNNYNFSSDKVFQEDILVNATADYLFKNLDNSTILVTGATGLIGHHIVSTFLKRNNLKGIHTKVIAPVRDLLKARAIYGDLFSDSNILFIENDITEPVNISQAVDYIVHGASVTSSKMFVENPVQTIDIAYRGTKNILELAKQKGVKKVVYLSSLEVYGIVDMLHPEVSENDLGTIDILSPRSSYSESKRMVECLNSAYYSQYDVPVVNARLAQTFGSGVAVDDSRVFAQFARSAINKQDIVLKTDGSTARDYCYISDAVQGILILLNKGSNGEAYNIANEETYISIKGMADLVSHLVTKDKIKVNINIQKNDNNGFAPKLKLKLLNKKIKGLGWAPKYELVEMYNRLIESMASRK